jgi:spoIIIJ-associated protein
MTIVQEEGRTAEEAVEAGLAKLRLSREYVLVEVVEEGTKGFLGLGGRPARVRLTVTPAGEQLVRTRDVVGELLKRMGVNVDVETREAGGEISIEINGEDAGLLIGRQGQTLEALTLLTARLLSRQFGERIRIEVDVEGYRERRRHMLEQRAFRLAERVKSTGEAVTLEPMSSGDRRTIHLALQRDIRVRTSSEGEGLSRRLVITPAERRD